MKTKEYVIILVFAIAAMVSCTKPSTNPTPPAVDARDKFIGDWQIHDTVTNKHFFKDYAISITKSTASDGAIQIYNFNNDGLIITAVVTSDSFSIPDQSVMGTRYQEEIQGKGNINGSNNLTYSYTDNVITNGYYYEVTAKGIKK